MTTFISNWVPNDPSPNPDPDSDPDPDLTPNQVLKRLNPTPDPNPDPDPTPNQVLKRVCTLLTKKEKNFTVTGYETGL